MSYSIYTIKGDLNKFLVIRLNNTERFYYKNGLSEDIAVIQFLNSGLTTQINKKELVFKEVLE